MNALFKQFINRIEFIQQLCVINQFKESLKQIDIGKFYNKHHSFINCQNNILANILATKNFNVAFKKQFHILSLKIMSRWDNSFYKKALKKGSIHQILLTYIHFYEKINQKETAKFLTEMSQFAVDKNLSLFDVLADTVFKVLRKKTNSILQQIQNHNRSSKKPESKQLSTIFIKDNKPSNKNYQLKSFRKQPKQRRILNYHSQQKTITESSYSSVRIRKNTPPHKVKNPSNLLPKIDVQKNYEKEITILPFITGRKFRNINIIQRFLLKFNIEYVKYCSLLSKQLDIQNIILQHQNQVQQQGKTIWLKNNYELLFYAHLQKNQKIKQSIQRYNMQFKKLKTTYILGI